tara:strand:+ start:18574 stop:19590 length:1017 start_codon:yes stop_codon:yes gene_type:complete
MVKRLFFILLLFTVVSKAQDIHFTQWMFSPLNLNPGETGRFDGDYRIAGNFRSQWGSIMSKQYNTLGLSYDRVFAVRGQELSAGLQFVNDRSSVGNLMQNKLMLSGGYNKLFKGNYFSWGAQIGLLHKGLDPNKYSYPVQWDNNIGEYSNQTGISNGENFTSTNEYLFDVNLGFGWARQLTDKLFPEIGVAFFHLNTPEESFFDNPENLQIRQVYNVRLNYKLNSKYVFSPNLLYSYHNQAQDMVIGAIGKMKMSENKSKIDEVFAGVNFRDGFSRNYDATNIIIGATREEWQVGLSYDINISNLSSITHYRGAFELSVIYIAQSSEPKIYNIPCDRY